MPSRSDVDFCTQPPQGEESDLLRFGRLIKRISWDLDITQEDKNFLEEKGVELMISEIDTSDDQEAPKYNVDFKINFLSWLKNRIEKKGYTLENVPDYMGNAYRSNDPSLLAPLIYGEWSNYRDFVIPLNPNDPDYAEKVWEKAVEGTKDYIAGSSGECDPDAQFTVKEIKYGPRGGAYTEDTTKDGRPYRRYF